MRIFRGTIVLLILKILALCSMQGIEIVIHEGNWGDVKISEIHSVLQSAAKVCMPYSAVLQNKKISVYETESSPMVHYDKEEEGFHRINLSAKNRFWCQYVFQFAHELGHLMCSTKRGNSANNWFEETLCEAASLFVLHELSILWTVTPPFPSWKAYAMEFKNYRNNRIKNSSLPENFQVSSWWKQNRPILSQNSNLRKQNLWMAVNILELIEEKPKSAWSACEWLNHSKSEKPVKFEVYLYQWKSACPQPKQKEFVDEIMNLFGLA